MKFHSGTKIYPLEPVDRSLIQRLNMLKEKNISQGKKFFGENLSKKVAK